MRHDRCEVHQSATYVYCSKCFVCKIFNSFHNKSGNIEITHEQYTNQHIIEQLLNRGYTIMRSNPIGDSLTIHIEPPKLKI